MTSVLGIATSIGPALIEVLWQDRGLAVTLAVADDAAKGAYVITHVLSGHAVLWFTSQAKACRAAKGLAAAGNWDRPYAEIVADTDLAAEAWRIRRTTA